MNPSLYQQLEKAGQQHIVQFLTQLDPVSRQKLEAQLSELDLATITRLAKDQVEAPDWGELARRATPPPAFRLNEQQPKFTCQQARERGEQALATGQVAAILVAGGQGSRLGFEHPKGMFPIGPVSQNSLFQILIERILATGRRYGTSIPLLVMTSPATHAETVEYLQANDRFGLPAEDLRVFCQGTMPAVDASTGKLLLAARDSLALAPDGHGGMLAALSKSKALAEMRNRGIELFSYGQIDNPLVQLCQPELIGYHLLSESEMTSQVVQKVTPLDKVGNVVMVDGKMQIIEYSDLPDDAADERNDDGSLKIWAGSIAVHVFNLSFLERIAAQADALPFHLANKKVAYINALGQQVVPESPNAIKFEKFIFDLLPWARNAIVVEGDPGDVFAPVKNAEGAETDTPTATRQAMIDLHTRWLQQAGVTVDEGVALEISPLWGLDPQEVAARADLPSAISQAIYLR